MLAVVLLSIGGAGLVFTLLNHWAAHRKIGQRAPAATSLPAISVLKPLKGFDPDLYDNLAALARQNYPNYEIIFGTEAHDDPALAVAHEVQHDHPEVRIRVVSGAPRNGLNPKVANLTYMSRYAAHDFVLVSDSNVRPGPDYLRAITAELRPGVGMVHNLMVGTGNGTVGSVLENLQLNGWVAIAVAGAERLAGHPCVVGKSMLFRQSDLRKVGGWHGVRDVLAEDYVLGVAFHRAGLRVALSSHVLAVINRGRPLADFLNRHLRWCQIRRQCVPAAYLGELLFNPLPFLVGALVAAVAGEQAGLAQAALAGVLAKPMADLWLGHRLGAKVRASDLAWVPVKDLLMLGIWLVGAFRTRVVWRGNAMRIGRGSRLYPLTAPAAQLRPARDLAGLSRVA